MMLWVHVTYLSGFPAAGFANKNHTLVRLDQFNELGVVLPHRKVLPLLKNVPEPLSEWSASVLVYLDFRDTRGRTWSCSLAFARAIIPSALFVKHSSLHQATQLQFTA